MSLSKIIRVVCVLIGVVIVSACGTMQPDTTGEAPQQTGTEQEATATETGQAQTADAALLNIPDPMKVDLPLDLIKGYDQVKTLLLQKQKEQAISKLQQLQTAFPQQSGPSYRLARLYLEAKQYEKSLQAIESCLAINKNNYYAHNLKGIVLREQGQFQEAKQAYISAVETFPAHAQSHLNLGILADIYLYDLPLALKHYQTYLKLVTNEDKKVNGWVLDLQRRMPSGE